MGYSHGKKWTQDSISKAVHDVMKALEIDRMPSNKECNRVLGDSSLSNAIAKRGGFYALARELNIPIKNSETSLGKRMEALVCEMLKSRGFNPVQMSVKFPYDIFVDGIKIDVKASHLYRGEIGNFYSFNLEKKYATCDIYILITLTEDNEVKDVFVVPSKFVMQNNQISVGEVQSKYNRFKDRWDYITSLSSYLSYVV